MSYYIPLNMQNQIQPRAIQKLDNWTYRVPTYKVTDEGIVEGEWIIISLCRGDKADPSKPRQEGVFSETLLEVVIQYLQSVNTGELQSRETSVAITNIEQGQMWLGKRAQDRQARGVQGSYQK